MANGIPGPVGAFLQGRQIAAGLQSQGLQRQFLQGQIDEQRRLQQQTQLRGQEQQRILGNVLSPQADRFGGQAPSAPIGDAFGTLAIPEAAQLSPEVERELLQANIAGTFTDSQLKSVRELALRQGRDPVAEIKRLNIESVQDANRGLALDEAGRQRLFDERIQRINSRNPDALSRGEDPAAETRFIMGLTFDAQTKALEEVARRGAGAEEVGLGLIKTGIEREKLAKTATEAEKQRGRLELKQADLERALAVETAKQAGIEKPLTFEQKESIKVNIKRLSTLSDEKVNRQSDIRRASRFLKGFKGELIDEEGKKVDRFRSGTTRRVIGVIPGVFSKQAQFEEELDSFAEKAARSFLKAIGEVRPTDADVVGVKKSLFGIGRDEKTNITLLTEFIAVQKGIENEFKDLRQAKKDGTLKDFIPSGSGARVELLDRVAKALAESRAAEARGAPGRGIGDAPVFRAPQQNFTSSRTGMTITVRRAE